MEAQVKHLVHECSRISDEGSKSFGELVKSLMEAGVERYEADLVRSEKTYYMPDGSSEVVPNATIAVAAAWDFTAPKVEAAVRAAQAGQIKYKKFCERVISAGCVGYHVSIAGKRVIYYGRTGDSHIEWFPGAR